MQRLQLTLTAVEAAHMLTLRKQIRYSKNKLSQKWVWCEDWISGEPLNGHFGVQ
jgi:hypothetical protein